LVPIKLRFSRPKTRHGVIVKYHLTYNDVYSINYKRFCESRFHLLPARLAAADCIFAAAARNLISQKLQPPPSLLPSLLLRADRPG
jgi:hypothetical protein